MKQMTLRRAAALALAVVMALTLTACGGGQPQDSSGQPQGSSGKLDTVTKSDTDAVQNGDTVTADSWQGFSDEAQAALDEVFAHRQHEYFAAAFLGYREEGDTRDLVALLYDNCPMMPIIWKFLTEIPEEDIIGDHGYLYCVVPLIENDEITVKGVEWETLGNGMQPHYSDPLYCGAVNRPFLMYVNYNDAWEDEPDLLLEYVREDGFVSNWFPAQNEGSVVNPTDSDGNQVILDFSKLYDITDYIPHLYYDYGPDAEWAAPTDLGLQNTSWYSDNGWVLEFSYRENWALTGNDVGIMLLYEPVPEEDSVSLSLYSHGEWRMEGDRVHIDIQDDQGVTLVSLLFPILIPPSGEQLAVMKADDGSAPPFFKPGQTCATLTLRYG